MLSFRTNLPLFFFVILMVKEVSSQKVYRLYPKHIPNSVSTENKEVDTYEKDSILIVKNVTVPTLTAFFPADSKSNLSAVIICPGGGYSVLAAKHEGYDVAKKFNEMGIAAFVLKYRIPDGKAMIIKEIAPLQDAQRAIQFVRMNARKLHINKKMVGIMGFSAGGHLASTAATHFSKNYIANKKKVNLRPDFLILVYPVISFTDTALIHHGSAENLLGERASASKLTEYSNELHVTPTTPPTFLVHAKDDPIKVGNSIAFAQALSVNHVPYQLYLYESGGHGFGMNNKTSPIKWMDIVEKWLKNDFRPVYIAE